MKIANVEPILKRVTKYDPYFKGANSNRIKSKLWVWGSLLVLVFCIIKRPEFYLLIISLCVVSIIVLVFSLGLKLPSPPVVYKEGFLVPSIIIQTKPLKLMVLVKTMKDEENILGVTIITVKKLPDTELKIGVKVPCVIYAIIPYEKNYPCENVDLHPICWATDDLNTINDSINTIDKQEWDILANFSDSLLTHPKFERYPIFLYFDNSLTELTPPDNS